MATTTLTKAEYPTTVEHAARVAAAKSPANRQLLALLGLLDRTQKAARAWLDAGHGGECGCAFCTEERHIGNTEWDVAGIEWQDMHAAVPRGGAPGVGGRTGRRWWPPGRSAGWTTGPP